MGTRLSQPHPTQSQTHIHTQDLRSRGYGPSGCFSAESRPAEKPGSSVFEEQLLPGREEKGREPFQFSFWELSGGVEFTISRRVQAALAVHSQQR